ncbi:hypothetical protein BJ944DRAFT_243125 [Cunninghamella echinulata]|nr:hypothetical protein BJ944DRAFT_243125 [Cunninghamella echinulata]
MASSPVNNYTILDIRTNGFGPEKTNKPTVTTTTKEVLEPKTTTTTVCPPSPPPSKDPSLQEDVFNDADLVETILTSLNQPKMKKSIPTYVLYDTLGLQLFDQITYLNEYYLTDCEANILERYADELADRVKNGTVLIELGAG